MALIDATSVLWLEWHGYVRGGVGVVPVGANWRINVNGASK